MTEHEQHIGKDVPETPDTVEVPGDGEDTGQKRGLVGRFLDTITSWEAETPPSEIAGLIDDTSRAATGR